MRPTTTRPLHRLGRATLSIALASAGVAAAGAVGCSTADAAGGSDKAACPAAACAAVAKAGGDDCCAVEVAAPAAAAHPATGPATAPATGPAATAAAGGGAATAPAVAFGPWRSLFDGKTLAGWKASGFAAQGEPEAKDGAIVLPVGEGLTGVTYAGDEPLPTTDYEVEVEARRAEGHDFFCGLTFPVNAAHATLVVGGWGGAVVGVSCIDGEDAAHNNTTQYMKFETGQWYRVRVRVLPERIQAWIDDKPVVDADTKGKKVELRVGTEEARPLGLATWQTTGEVRAVKIRRAVRAGT